MTLKGLKGPPHVGRSNIAVPSIYKEVHALSHEHVGLKIFAEIKIYILSRAKLLIKV